MTVRRATKRRTFVVEGRDLRVEIADAADAEILAACRSAGRFETGGILIGHYNTRHDTAVVVEALSQPRDSRAGPSWFQRGVADVDAALQARWKRSPRLYYLGEWHYHPSESAEPSRTDHHQMAEIAADHGYRCPEPILAILGGDPSGQSVLSVTVVHRGGALSRLVEHT